MLTRGRGLTLVELLVAITMAGILGAATVGVVIRQQRFYRDLAARTAARDAVRDATLILRRELAPLAPAAGDLYAIAPRSVDFRVSIATGVVCTIAPARTSITIPPQRVSTAVPYTAWIESPRASDTLLVYDVGAVADPRDDAWRPHVLAADPIGGGTCPASSGLTTGAEVSRGWRLELDPPLEPTIQLGAPIRVVRRARYELYRASDARWYLGYFDCLASRASPCATVQPVSGPYPAAGLRFEFADSSGVPTADPARVRRITILAAAGAPGDPSATDSLTAPVALRN